MYVRSILALSVLAFSGLTSVARATDYTVDATHSHIGFTAKHMVSKVPGDFKDFSGTFSFDEKNPSSFKADFTIKVASIDTNEPKRDAHLKSPDFFDAEKFPEIKFTSTSLKAVGNKKYKLTGDMTMHGVTKPVTFDVEYLGSEKDPWGNAHAGFSAMTKIDRKDFGIVWNKTLDTGGLLVANEVGIQLDIDATPPAAKK
jgi:polyisoprenoid-binding protein YceI